MAETSWPHNLQRKHNLQLERGATFVLDEVEYAVIGFDGRDEGYICWRRAADGAFDTTECATIECTRLAKAQFGPPCMGRAPGRSSSGPSRAGLPPLPKLDHTGRIAGTGSSRSSTPARALSRATAVLTSPQKKTATPRRTQAVRPPFPALPPPFSAVTGTATPSAKKPHPEPVERFGRTSELISSDGQARQVDDTDQSPPRGPVPHANRDEPDRDCLTCAVCRLVTGSLTGALSVLVTRMARLRCMLANPALQDCPGGAAAVVKVPGHEPCESSIFESLRINIPVVRPHCWSEVRPIVECGVVAFDESDWKEIMTVRYSRWASFVDRQREGIERELGDLRRGSGGSGDSTSSSIEDGTTDLERLLASMGDWKDVSRFSGRSVSMASTQRGSEMRLHVVAFVERADESGIDFMRISYRKMVEVPRRADFAAERRDVSADHSPLSGGQPGLICMGDPWGHKVQLLRRPDVARFAIALAFREALARDGLHLDICDAPAGRD